MSKETRYVAVDGMGGDFSPHAVIEGVLDAARAGVPVLLYGPEKKLVRYLGEQCADWESLGIKVVHASDVVGMAEEPVYAVRKKPDSSLVKAVQSLADGRAHAVFSAGNSGALMAASLFVLGRQEGIDRPAIAGLLPTLKGSVIALDLGANVDCRPHYLQQFAEMGSLYAERLLNISSPRVGLLSNGAERGKGTVLVKQVAALLEESTLNFIGNVEPIDIINHGADVVVCDGFAGNVLLKTMEATATMIRQALAHELSNGGLLRESGDGERVRAMLEKALISLDERFGEAAQSGARLLGVNGIVLVGHGAAHAPSISRSIRKAYNIILAEK
ncbi:MAG: phosphate acyltransferase [Candidatus Dependentiae bacterium]|nr:phosphate acyltransferase [Candidatus Dependentiae bacterium]